MSRVGRLLQIGLKPEEHALFEQRVAESGLTKADYVRRAVFGDAALPRQTGRPRKPRPPLTTTYRRVRADCPVCRGACAEGCTHYCHSQPRDYPLVPREEREDEGTRR